MLIRSFGFGRVQPALPQVAISTGPTDNAIVCRPRLIVIDFWALYLCDTVIQMASLSLVADVCHMWERKLKHYISLSLLFSFPFYQFSY